MFDDFTCEFYDGITFEYPELCLLFELFYDFTYDSYVGIKLEYPEFWRLFPDGFILNGFFIMASLRIESICSNLFYVGWNYDSDSEKDYADDESPDIG